MTWPVVLLNDRYINQTLSTIKFDKFGSQTNQVIFICNSWQEGFDWVKQNNYSVALFVRSGTMFKDWNLWTTLIEKYPHKGLVGHLIKYPNQPLYIDDQCWLIDVTNFKTTDLAMSYVTHPIPELSDKNLHDNYTPLWAKPGSEFVSYSATNFGQGLIANQLSNNQIIVNWNNTARDIKSFIYTDTINLEDYTEYKNIAENQLWIFNNETITVVNEEKLVTPGSGLSWIFNIISSKTLHIQIVDISAVQIKFCEELWAHWDGTNYGIFAWDFITNNNVSHFQVDNPELTPLEQLMLKSKSRFIEYVNIKFSELLKHHNITNFTELWNKAKTTKTVKFSLDNLIHWVINNDITEYNNIWCSNILNYKWTLLHTTAEEYHQFQLKIK